MKIKIFSVMMNFRKTSKTLPKQDWPSFEICSVAPGNLKGQTTLTCVRLEVYVSLSEVIRLIHQLVP